VFCKGLGPFVGNIHSVPRATHDADAVNVAKVQGETLDHGYLLKWAKELSVDELLKKLFAALD